MLDGRGEGKGGERGGEEERRREEKPKSYLKEMSSQDALNADLQDAQIPVVKNTHSNGGAHLRNRNENFILKEIQHLNF